MNKKAEYKESLKHPLWQKKRLEIFNRDNFTCQKCGDTETELQVHHKEYYNGFEPWEYDNSILITYCVNCHQEIEGITNSNGKSLYKIKKTCEEVELPYSLFVEGNLQNEKEQYSALVEKQKNELLTLANSSIYFLNTEEKEAEFKDLYYRQDGERGLLSYELHLKSIELFLDENNYELDEPDMDELIYFFHDAWYSNFKYDLEINFISLRDEIKNIFME